MCLLCLLFGAARRRVLDEKGMIKKNVFMYGQRRFQSILLKTIKDRQTDEKDIFFGGTMFKCGVTIAVVFLVINGMLDVLWYHLKGIREGKLEK